MHISLPELDSEIVILKGTENSFAPHFEWLRKKYSSCFVISDKNVYPLYGKQIELSLGMAGSHFIVPPGEEAKTLLAAQQCWNKMHEERMDRKSCVIGIGGGAVTDLAGFVAASYMRGIDVIHIPTTLVGMVDAAIGGKCGINLETGKSIVGAFHHPKRVLIAPHLLNTLPVKEFRSGLAEVIKYGVISDPTLFHYLEENISDILAGDLEKTTLIIERSCTIKAEIVRADAKEKGIRSHLNWGHTFAHAIETATGYRQFSHGEAVAIGMGCAAQLSQRLGLVDQDFVDRQDRLCQKAGLPISLPNIELNQFIKLMSGDKKAEGGKISLILAEKLGKVCKLTEVDKQKIEEALSERT